MTTRKNQTRNNPSDWISDDQVIHVMKRTATCRGPCYHTITTWCSGQPSSSPPLPSHISAKSTSTSMSSKRPTSSPSTRMVSSNYCMDCGDNVVRWKTWKQCSRRGKRGSNIIHVKRGNSVIRENNVIRGKRGNNVIRGKRGNPTFTTYYIVLTLGTM